MPIKRCRSGDVKFLLGSQLNITQDILTEKKWLVTNIEAGGRNYLKDHKMSLWKIRENDTPLKRHV